MQLPARSYPINHREFLSASLILSNSFFIQFVHASYVSILYIHFVYPFYVSTRLWCLELISIPKFHYNVNFTLSFLTHHHFTACILHFNCKTLSCINDSDQNKVFTYNTRVRLIGRETIKTSLFGTVIFPITFFFFLSTKSYSAFFFFKNYCKEFVKNWIRGSLQK